MSDVIEAFKLVGSLIGKIAEIDQTKRQDTAKTFAALARTFAAFSPAYYENDQNEMLKLEAIEQVANAKELLSRGDQARDKVVLIIQAAGFFEGYAVGLDPDVLK